MDEIIRVSGAEYRFEDGTMVAFQGRDLVVHPGERVLLLGPNGSGKSTLLSLLMGLRRPTKGLVRVFGYDPAATFDRVGPRMGVLLQDRDKQIIAPSVHEDIGFSPRNYGMPAPEVNRRVHAIAAQLEIEHLLGKVPHYLSGGERLKVALAGALVMEPDLLLLDEPFEGLDTTSKSELANLINDLRRERNVSVVVSTHEVNIVPSFVDTLYLFARGGGIVGCGPALELLADTELLARHHLEPPVLAELFAELRRRGFDLESKLTVDQAADELDKSLRDQCNNHISHLERS